MSFAQQTKHRLFEIISEMASHPGDFSNHPETDFSRNRKLDFHNLLQLIVSMEAGSVKDELLKFFSFAKDTASHSAFFQQRAKLSDDALPYLFHSFNKLYPYTFYKDKYQLLAADGSSFTFTRNPLDIDSYFAPDGKTTNAYNQVHIIPLFDLISKRYTDCVVQPVRKKNEFRALCTLIDRHQTVPGIVPVFIADRGGIRSMLVISCYMNGGVFDNYRQITKGKIVHRLQKGKEVLDNKTRDYNAKNIEIFKSTFNKQLKKMVGPKKRTSAKFYMNTPANRKLKCR